MKVKEIQELIDFITKSGLEEVNIETEEIKIKVRRNPLVATQSVEKPSSDRSVDIVMPTPPAAIQEVSGATNLSTAVSKGPQEENYVEVKSPMTGTFYRGPNPEAEPFVKEGAKIEKNQTVCIIEAMKLFNEIESEISGTIVKVLVENASPVEYDQSLFLIDPS
ncbi:MAG: acetyl-CoA carboxylase biotin carboxyl carrier protein [Cytophagales bacterium]|nr:acetyl-CoA carboxylase biotin carboxyl carrier protein [Cytophagales bacterium]